MILNYLNIKLITVIQYILNKLINKFNLKNHNNINNTVNNNN